MSVRKIYIDLVLLAARLASGVLMLPHGWRKVGKIMEGDFKFANPIGIGEKASLICTAGAEFGASILLIAGLFTRVSAAILAFTAFVIAFVHHFSDPMEDKELGLMYLVVYLTILTFGAGKFSADYLIQTYIRKR
ncbi:MAG: hypothetical protein RL220_2005 [Bacteroidota bacterium]|jgi:putative oxidoreductase